MLLNSTELGEGPPVVLLHGLFGTARNLGAVARGLAAVARVFAFDLRNHGDSPHDPRMDYPTMAEDVAETMAAKGLDAARVAGHSMGGKVAMMLALLHPGRVQKLAVLDIAPIDYEHGYARYVAAMQRIPLQAQITRRQAGEMLAPDIPDNAMRLFLLSNLVLGENPHWRFGLDEIAQALPRLMAWRLPAGVAPYPGPALFLRGGTSDYVPEEAAAPIRAWFPKATIETIPHAAHWLHADQPQAVIHALERFLP